MKKLLLASSFLLGGMLSAGAVIWLPDPVVTSETVDDNGVTINWTFDETVEGPCDHFQVIVYNNSSLIFE